MKMVPNNAIIDMTKTNCEFLCVLKPYWALFVFFPFLNWGMVYPNLPRGVGPSFATLFLLSN